MILSQTRSVLTKASACRQATVGAPATSSGVGVLWEERGCVGASTLGFARWGLSEAAVWRSSPSCLSPGTLGPRWLPSPLPSQPQCP